MEEDAGQYVGGGKKGIDYFDLLLPSRYSCQSQGHFQDNVQ